jgi:L-asparaginase
VLASPPARVVVIRGGVVESTHVVHAAVVRADGELVAALGDPARVTTMRSAAKPLQADPLVRSGAFDQLGLDDRTLAVACASHLGADEHVAAVRAGLEAAEVDPELLRNDGGDVERRLRHNCSGNHMNFLALSRMRGWDLDSYRSLEHPSQKAALAAVAEAAGVPQARIETGRDGCGVVCFGLPLRTIALMFARLAERMPRQAAAMRAHPELVRGDGALDTELMRAVPGAVSKAGAEALQAICLGEQGLGVAIRCEDGAHRAVEPSCVALLRGLLRWGEIPDGLRRFERPQVFTNVGEPAGEVVAELPGAL